MHCILVFLVLGGPFAALQVRGVQGVQAVPAEVEDDLAEVDDDDLAEDLAELDELAAEYLADADDDDLAKVDDDDLAEDLAKLDEVAAEYLADADDDDLAKVDEDVLAEVTSQGGLETGLLRCCQPCRCRSVAGLAVTDLLSF